MKNSPQSTVHSRQPVMSFSAILVILLLSSSLFAQAPYTGGSGDGHAITELVLRNVGVEEISSSPFQVYPTVVNAGEGIFIKNKNTQPYTIRIIDITGKVQLETSQQFNHSTIHYTIPGVSFVVLESLSGRMVQKITVLE